MKVKANLLITKTTWVLLLAVAATFAHAQKAKPQKFTFVKKVAGSNSPNLGKSITITGDLVGKIESFGGAEVWVFAEDKGKEVLITNLSMLPQLAKNGIDVDLKKPRELYTVSYSTIPKGLGNDLEFRQSSTGYTINISSDSESDAKITSEIISVYEGMPTGKTQSRQASTIVGGFKTDADLEKFKAMFK